MIGEYFKKSAPGGMAAVLASYDLYFENMKFIPTWKAGGFLTKLWYAVYSTKAAELTARYNTLKNSARR